MASCYGGAGAGAEVFTGLAGRELVQHILPISWQLDRWAGGNIVPGAGVGIVSSVSLSSFTVTLGTETFTEEDCRLEIDFFSSEAERVEAMRLMNLEIEAGTSWPFEETFPTLAAFSHYFMSHAAFVARVTNWADKSAR